MYYAGYGAENGDFEGFDFNYLLAIALTVICSFTYIMRNVGSRMQHGASIENPVQRQYPFTLLLLTSVDFSITTLESVLHMRGAFEEKVREALERAANDAKRDKQKKSFFRRIEGDVRRYIESTIFVFMLLLTAWGINKATTDYDNGRHGPLYTCVLSCENL